MQPRAHFRSFEILSKGKSGGFGLQEEERTPELFIRGRSTRSDAPLTIAATNDAYGLATRFSEIDPAIRLLADDNATSVDWSALVTRGQEEWPIAYLLPFGAFIPRQ